MNSSDLPRGRLPFTESVNNSQNRSFLKVARLDSDFLMRVAKHRRVVLRGGQIGVNCFVIVGTIYELEFAERPWKGGFTSPSCVRTTQIQVTVRLLCQPLSSCLLANNLHQLNYFRVVGQESLVAFDVLPGINFASRKMNGLQSMAIYVLRYNRCGAKFVAVHWEAVYSISNRSFVGLSFQFSCKGY